MNFNTIYNHAVPESPSGQKSMTDPQFAKDCDIYNIIRKYQAGLLPQTKPMTSGDFSEFTDFQSCLEKVNRAMELFDGLPAELRAKFNNDPREFGAFVTNPGNVDECCKLGILSRRGEDAFDVLKDIRNGVTAKAAEPATAGEGNAS